MTILLIEPFYTGSHRAWVEGYRRHSSHRVEALTLPGRFWKWRMTGGAPVLAREYDRLDYTPDLIVASDMLDAAAFRGMCRRPLPPIAVYFHENQLTYPWPRDETPPKRERNRHYPWINVTSALAADAVLFNSEFHQRSFLQALAPFLRRFPDTVPPEYIEEIRRKSAVLPLGLRLDDIAAAPETAAMSSSPLLLWNHRWEYDKGPEAFFDVLYELSDRGMDFRLAVLGQADRRVPDCFTRARRRLGERIAVWGEVLRDRYVEWLGQCDILPVTSYQDFFGISVAEAIYAGVVPLLPRRVAYPELIPPRYHNDYLYDEGDLAERLRRMLTEKQRPPAALSRHIARFDWRRMAAEYDRVLSRFAAGG